MLEILLNRSYVFLFLLAYLYLAIRSKGVGWTCAFLICGYAIALLSEGLSIRTGFPYGWYVYLYQNIEPQSLVWGVPFWDSISYVFLSYAGLGLAEYVTGTKRYPSRFMIIFLAALFTVILDMVIDPIAHMGGRWFLGEIYYYPHPGFYFDVPVSNFLGWFGVSALIAGVGLGMEAIFRKDTTGNKKFILSPLFYFVIFVFNLGITIFLQEWLLLFCDVLLLALPVGLFVRSWCKKDLETTNS